MKKVAGGDTGHGGSPTMVDQRAWWINGHMADPRGWCLTNRNMENEKFIFKTAAN